MLTKEQPYQRRILIIRYTRWPVLLLSVSLFLQSLLPLPSELIYKVAMAAEIDVIQRHRVPLTKACLVISTVESPTANSIDQYQLEIWHYFSGHLTSHWADCIGPFPPWKRKCIVLTRIDTYFGHGFAFPSCGVSSKTIHLPAYRMLYSSSWYPVQPCFLPENSFYREWMQYWSFYHLEAADLTELRNSLLKAQFSARWVAKPGPSERVKLCG